MRPVRHFSRALHQVSACARKSARHPQVRSPNMRTSQHIAAVSVRVVHICSSKSWLTWTNATGRNDLQTANTLIPRKHHAANITAINDFGCTETQADGSNSEGIRKDFFSFRDVVNSGNKTTTKVLAQRASVSPTSPGSRETLFSFFLFSFFSFIN